MKKQLKHILALALTAVLLISVLTACGNAEKTILGKWYNDAGDCLEIQSDNTYQIHQVSDKIYESGLKHGEWEYLEEEDIFKFYADNYDGDIVVVEIVKDETGTHLRYTYFGTFYKD